MFAISGAEMQTRTRKVEQGSKSGLKSVATLAMAGRRIAGVATGLIANQISGGNRVAYPLSALPCRYMRLPFPAWIAACIFVDL